IFNKLDEENTYGVICGDFIEGVHVHIADQFGKARFTLDDQIFLAREKLRPYVNKGKILAIVGWFNGHEGSWSDIMATISAIKFLKDGLIQPDGTKLQAIYNGGILKMNLSNGDVFILKTFHDAGSGGSDDINPVGSQRRAAWSEKVNSPNMVDGVVAGHQHHRAATAKELTYNKLTGKEVSQVLLALGTVKGNDDKHADKYLIAQAKGPTLPPGGSIILNQRGKNNDRGDHVWATYGYDKGGVLYKAAKILDATERQGITKEVLAKIMAKEGKPVATFDRRNSRTRTKEDKSKTPLFETFRWKIKDGNLPIMVYLLANTRYGSSSGERDRAKLLEIYDQVANDPFKYVLAMRHYVDDSVAKDFERESILSEVAGDLKKVYDANSLLGFMLSNSLRVDSWSKQLLKETPYFDRHKKNGGWKTKKEYKKETYPGDYFYRDSVITKTPIYLNDSLMLLNLNGKTEYVFHLLDNLSWSGSEFDMFRGLVQAGRKGRLALDVVAGGHMPGAGVMVTPDGVFVSTGWFSDYDSRNKSNIKRAPLGGQAVILFPNEKIVIPASTFTEATDMHASVMLKTGLSKEEREKILYKSKR
ncbi:MAG: hypothetical protein NT162_01890, partial [Candidatus Woesebacteria bacterium]|nr:hypothetical protein [Candidatus Woesebacteria bacterium]